MYMLAIVDMLRQACQKQFNYLILLHACGESGHCVVCQGLADCHGNGVGCAHRSLQIQVSGINTNTLGLLRHVLLLFLRICVCATVTYVALLVMG